VSKAASKARPAANAQGDSAAVAVIADPSHRAEIVKVLKREGFGPTGFGSAVGLAAQVGGNEHALIVLWVEDTVSGLSGCIDPLTQSSPHAPVIVVCSDIERWGVREALMAGAAGVVLWKDLDRALAPSVQAALAGQACVPRGHWREIEPPALSSREKQILGLVVMGYSNSQIAQQLFLAESTVKSHLSSAFGKLGVRSRNEAVHLILDPDRGLGMGILALGGEPMESSPTAVRGHQRPPIRQAPG
jgi:DNA-binding NarL/FixJ family response regulator